MAICFAACLLLFFGALATVLSSKQAEDTGDDGTESEAYYPTAPAGNIPQLTPSSAGGEASSGDGATPGVTRVTRKPLPLRPLVCSYKLDMNKDYPYPPDGLCDFLFHTFGVLPEGFNYNEYEEVTDDDRALFDKFKDEAMKSKITLFGIDIYDHFENNSILTLNTDEGKAALRGLWDYKIVHYACLDFFIFALGDHFAMKIGMLAKILMELRDEYRSLHETENSFFFLGIGAANENRDERQVTVLRYAMSIMLPDAVLYRTTRTNSYDYASECTFVPPSQWSESEESVQMTFSAAFRMRKLSTWPSSVVQMMSFSPGITYMDGGDPLVFNSKCDGYTLKPASFRCSPDNGARDAPFMKSPDGMDVYRLGNISYMSQLGHFFAGYDTPESMKRKMCKSVVEHNFSGGWTVLHMEYSIVDGKGCNDTNYQGNYQMVQALRDLMKINFTANDCP
ncbi:uncharacterized protein LOC135373811 isoform X1 [Ornithodoros turicata]|uniref:uncharacterized protein LOC135373811 isoform X1 n=1 Tax=Ornithodoros turicata TaxID=34597 RepID=UPI00313A1FB4